MNDIPNHIAIIMDGNRRWAKAHNLPMQAGHKAGAETLEKILRYMLFRQKIGKEVKKKFLGL